MVMLNRDTCTIQIVGVGGQGALTVSRIIGAAALKKNVPIIISEIHGMAQRGGVVKTTIRLGDTISPLPFKSDITCLVGFEPLEVYRARDEISKDTVVVISTDPIRPISVSSWGKVYPEVDDIIEEVKKHTECTFSLSAREKAQEAGNERVTNVLPFTCEELREAIGESVPEKSLEANLKAFDLGYGEVHDRKK
ncbi:pyruvate ferredoxin oxidoreductase [Thermoplasmatales archaeon ex4484_6]|nr:MAG: pyruvate ferredoxin oxidoreductase [Thermoplasmatales archaeon ex4484_6]